MVKSDVRRDYYTDLGVGPNADQDEIKKKFRNLALKYHPDRNRGREAEFNVKFQAIQAAHEILGDPQQRLKYDTDRLRAGYGKLYGPPRKSAGPRPHNPYQPHPNAPRKAPTAHQSKPSFPSPGSYPPPPTSAGAQKYASYAKAGAQNPHKTYEAEMRARAEAFRGFKDMKSDQHMPGGWTNFDPRTGRSSYHEKPTAPRPQQANRPQSAYHAFAAEAKQAKSPPERTKTPKRSGFAPGTPGGDEPMAKSTSAYVSVSRGDRPKASSPRPYADAAPSPTTKKQPPYEGRPTAVPNLQRSSSKYAAVGGEKTYVSGSGLGRSTSVREDAVPRSHTNPPSPTSPTGNRGRHHSASPKLKPNRDRPFSASSTSSSDTDEVIPHFRPKAVPRSRLAHKKSNAGPFATEGRNPLHGETFLGWAMRPDSWLFAETGGFPNQAATNHRPEPWNLDADNEPQGNGDNNPAANTAGRDAARPTPIPNGSGPPRMRTEAADEAMSPKNRRASATNMYDTSPKPSAQNWSEKWGFSWKRDAGGSPSSRIPLWAYPTSILPHLPSSRKQATEGPELMSCFSNMETACSCDFRPNQTSSYHSQSRTNADSNTSNSFNSTAINPDSIENLRNTASKSKSYESIDTNFSAGNWNFGFDNGAGVFLPKSSKKTEAPQFSGVSGRKRSSRTESRSRPTTASHSPSPLEENPPPKSAAPFAEARFSADQWAEALKSDTWSMPHVQPSRQRSLDQQRQKSPKKQPKTTSKRTTVPKPAKVTTESDETEATFVPKSVNESRQPFSGDADAMDVDDDLPSSTHPAGPTAKSAAKPAPLNPETRPSVNTKSELFSLNNLGLVNPFTTTNEGGINDLKDLNTTLPFDSKPSANKSTTKLHIRPRDLALPKPPKSPSAPKFTNIPLASCSVSEQSLAKATCERYMIEMSTYMREWNSFNKTMLTHFNERQNLVENGLSPGWISAVGDSNRLNLNTNTDSFSGAGGKGSSNTTANDRESDDDEYVSGQAKGGFSAYLRGVEEDFVVRQHWEVAWERHRDSILELGAVREWLRNGGKAHQPTSGEQPAN